MNPAQPPAAGDAEHIEYARWLAPGCAVAAICLGLALQIANGFLEPTALALVLSAFALLVAAAVIPRPARFVRLDATLVPVLALAGLVFHLVSLLHVASRPHAGGWTRASRPITGDWAMLADRPRLCRGPGHTEVGEAAADRRAGGRRIAPSGCG